MKIKHWIIRKLGGYVPEDIPLKIRLQILEVFSLRTIDKDIARTLNNDFYTTKYTKD